MTDIISKAFGAGNNPESENKQLGPMSKERFRGQITKLDPSGWGFISSKQVPFTRIFFHWSALTQDTLKFPALKEKMAVEFNTVEVPEKGTRATRMRVVDSPE